MKAPLNETNLIIFATGGKLPDEGGSGMNTLLNHIDAGDIPVSRVSVVGNYAGGGVETKARKHGVHFEHFPKALRTAEGHEALVDRLGGEHHFVTLSGCLWLVPMKKTPDDPEPGLDPRYVVNIHPGPLSIKGDDGHPRYGGEGMYGHFVHERVMEDYRAGRIKASAVTMHFVTKDYDKGPIIFEWPVPIMPWDTPETLGKAVNVMEHRFQPYVTNLVLERQIRWDGVDPRSLRVPSGYDFLPTTM